VSNESAPFRLKNVATAVVIGGGHGIGLALVTRLLERAPTAKIFASYRQESEASELIELSQTNSKRLTIVNIDPCEETELASFATELIKKRGSVELLINAVGFLYDEKQQPEKGLESVAMSSLMKYFAVNAVVTPLLAKHFLSGFQHAKPSCFTVLSAKVGSIGDNNLGGWYGYRASKAALNMFVRTISLEFARRRCRSVVLAVHPGTTLTKLSQPFINKTPYKLNTPLEAASNILNVIDNKTTEDSGSFYSWDNKPIPW